MIPSLRRLSALVLAAFVALPASAQDDRAAPDDEEPEIVIEHDGNVYRFRVPGDAPLLRSWRDDDRFSRADTVIDGRRIIRFRLPGGHEDVFEFEMPDFDDEAFRRQVVPELDRLRVSPPDLPFKHDGEPLGLSRFHFDLDDWVEGPRGLGALSSETRRELAELERRTNDLAAEARRAEGREREEIERELDEALEQLFDVRGQMREEQAARLEERAERLGEEAGELRESLRERDRERRALIEERKRELVGEPGADW